MSVKEDLALLVLAEEYMAQRMKALEVWQATMDMTLKRTFEDK